MGAVVNSQLIMDSQPSTLNWVWARLHGRFQRDMSRWLGKRLYRIQPKTPIISFTFPIGSPRPSTKRNAAKYFACCRGGGQVPNVGETDLNYLHAFFLEQSVQDVASIKRTIDRNGQLSGWLIFGTHDVTDRPS